MIIRFVSADDGDALLSIYQQYIDTPITCEYVLPSREEFLQRITDISAVYPYLVCEENNQIIGYAYAHRHMERKAYEWNAELSVYINQNYTSKGLGTKFYTMLSEILAIQGIKTLIGGVTLPNKKSQQLHESFGFTYQGIYHNTAFKNGEWFDVAWYEKQIAPYTQPDPLIPITEIPKENLLKIMETK